MKERIWGRHKRLVAAVAAIAAVVVIGGGAFFVAGATLTPGSTPSPSFIALASPSTTATPTASPTATPTPTPTPTATPTPPPGPTAFPTGWVYSDLDGAPAPPDKAHRLPMAVMIDDNAAARPQSGISSASIVIQAMADGGEDRYEMIFQENDASDIGPVRSARPYFVYWAAEYRALYGHFGGDAEARTVTIPAMAKYIYNEDDLNGGSCPYHRITTRPAPHNAYTNTADLIRCLKKRGYPTTYQKAPTRPFRDDSSWSTLPASQLIAISYRTGTIRYQFDPTKDSYLRSINGVPEIDPANNQQVYARDIVVMFQSYAIINGLDEMRPFVGNVGSGQAIVFEEGKAVTATWKKTSDTALTRFYDKSGKEISLVRGEIFLQSVPIGTSVTY